MGQPILLFVVVFNIFLITFAIDTSQVSVEDEAGKVLTGSEPEERYKELEQGQGSGQSGKGKGQGTGQGAGQGKAKFQGGKGQGQTQNQGETFESCEIDENCYRKDDCDDSECGNNKQCICLNNNGFAVKPPSCSASKSKCNTMCEATKKTLGGYICKPEKMHTATANQPNVNRCFCAAKE